MYKVAILSSGPSLRATWSEDDFLDYDTVIGVNRAGWVYQCDWLAFFDKGIVDSGNVRHVRKGYLTSRKNAGLYGVDKDKEVVEPQRLGLDISVLPTDVRELSYGGDLRYTFPLAIDFGLGFMDHGELHIFGMDCRSTVDVAGEGGDRSTNRWLQELPWVRYILDCRKKGVDVYIHGNLRVEVKDYLFGKCSYKYLRKRLLR